MSQVSRARMARKSRYFHPRDFKKKLQEIYRVALELILWQRPPSHTKRTAILLSNQWIKSPLKGMLGAKQAIITVVKSVIRLKSQGPLAPKQSANHFRECLLSRGKCLHRTKWSCIKCDISSTRIQRTNEVSCIIIRLEA